MKTNTFIFIFFIAFAPTASREGDLKDGLLAYKKIEGAKIDKDTQPKL